MPAGRDIKPEHAAAAFLRAIPADEYLSLREMVVEYALNSGQDESADFEFRFNGEERFSAPNSNPRLKVGKKAPT